jgi:hypothetical protein
VGVDGVAAGQILRRLAGGEHILAANRTIVPEVEIIKGRK